MDADLSVENVSNDSRRFTAEANRIREAEGNYLERKVEVWRCRKCLDNHRGHNIRDSQWAESAATPGLERNRCPKGGKKSRNLQSCRECPNYEYKACRFWCTNCPYDRNNRSSLDM